MTSEQALYSNPEVLPQAVTKFEAPAKGQRPVAQMTGTVKVPQVVAQLPVNELSAILQQSVAKIKYVSGNLRERCTV